MEASLKLTTCSSSAGGNGRPIWESGTGEMGFENDLLVMSLSPDFRITSMELKEKFEGEFSLSSLAEMAVILKGIATSLSFLPFDHGG